MKDKLVNLIRNTYGSSDAIDNIHTKNLINNLNATIEIYCIKFSYITMRNNSKERKVYLTPSAGYENLEQEFYKWLENYNSTNPYRKLSNVKILDSRLYETYSIYL